METVYLGLGANLNSPLEQLKQAVAALKLLPHCHNLAVSSFYSSRPMGPQDQPDYVNAVARLDTELTPLALLDLTQKIELDLGRVRKEERWGPRTLDIDILLFGGQLLDCERLTVPHYGIKEREFVLLPLLELVPELCLPDGTPVAELAATIERNGLSIINES